MLSTRVGGAIGGVLVGADVDTHHAVLVAAPERGLDAQMAGVVEAETVDQSAVADQAEDARLRVADLRQRRHGANLGKAEADPDHDVGHASVLVEARRDADRIGQMDIPDIDAEARVIGTFRMTPRLSLVGEGRYWETVSNDVRIQYERTQFILGVRWEQ